MCGIGFRAEHCFLSSQYLEIFNSDDENINDADDENVSSSNQQQQESSSSSSSMNTLPMVLNNESGGDDEHDWNEIENTISNLISKRGPDYLGKLKVDHFTFISSVLSLRGDDITKQPIVNSDQILLWNGEIFNYPNMENQLKNGNDTNLLFELLNNHINDEEEIISIFNNIQGPFAFIYFNIKFNYLLFGRDRIGKRSLVFNYSNGNLIISSNSIPGMEFKSIPPFIFQLKNNQLKKYEYKSNFINKERILCKELENLESEDYKNVLNEFYKIFSDSIHKRINFLQRPKETNLEINNGNGNLIENEANYAILFSGGIDSLVLASLSHLNSLEDEKITLLNVSFGNSLEQVSKGHDRIQSIEAFKMLNDKYGNRFNLVLIDILKDQLEEHAQLIKQLIYPNNTVLDYTIGCVLWFASRGQGYLHGDDSKQLVQSQSRVLLCGVGSDELLGGYRRYLKRFKDQGWDGLNEEMNMDLNRLWFRNLGRDDRIIASHGRECRHPFLDENLIEFVQSLPLSYIVDLRDKIEFEIKEGCNNSKKFQLAKDKLLLRQMVSQVLGLESNQPKKAMQFASNVAKITLTTSRRKERGNKCID